MADIDPLSQHLGEIRAEVRSLQHELVELKSRELAELKELIDKRFASYGERTGKLELECRNEIAKLQERLDNQVKNRNGNNWRTKVVLLGGGAGGAELLRRLLEVILK